MSVQQRSRGHCSKLRTFARAERRAGKGRHCWSEPLERRVLLAAQAVTAELLSDSAPPALIGDRGAARSAPVQGRVMDAIPIDQSGVVNGVVYSNLGQGSGYAAFDLSTGQLGFDDYNSTNNADINLTQFQFVGGVSAAGGTLMFEFYDASEVFITEIEFTFSQSGNFIYPLAPSTPVTIPDAGFMQVVAAPGTTGQWFLSDASPTVGTQSSTDGGANGGALSHKFEFTNNSGPAGGADLSPALFGGWDDAVVISTTSGTNSDAGAILNGTSIFVDYAVGNFGTAAAGAFSTVLMLDDVVVDTLNTPGLAVNTGDLREDVNLGVVGPGIHTLKMVIDNGNAVAESRETDNTFIKQFFVASTLTGEIHGTKWNDVDGDGEQDGGEPGLAGWTIYLDANDNGLFDAGSELSDVTDAAGNYDLLGVPNGLHIVREVPQSGWNQTFPGPAGVSNNDFKVTVDFLGGLSPTQQAAFTTAANKWAQMITGDLVDLFSVGFFVDDVRISAQGTAIDGVGGTLGSAGPSLLRPGSFLPARGSMRFDTADLADMEADGSLVDVIVHEMGHVLGIGTVWNTLGLLSGAGGSDPRFTGANATAEYNAIFGSSFGSVPVENTGGAGTRDGHWRESVFANELMTGFLNAGANPLSRITVASLLDMGYEVDLNAADSYVAPGPGALREAPEELRFERLDRDPMIAHLDASPAGAAAADGTFAHEVHVDAGESVLDIDFGNVAAGSPPTADIADVTADPRAAAVGAVTINFSENVSNVDIADFTLTRDGAAVSLAGLAVSQVNPTQYTVDLTTVTGRAGSYLLTLNASGSGIVDTGGTPLAADASDAWIMNAVNGTAAGDAIKLRRAGGGESIEVFLDLVDATPDYTVNIAALGSNGLTVFGLGGDDLLLLDFANGTFSPAGGIAFDGGASSAGDTLVLQGTGASENASFTDASFSFGATPVSYSATEKFRFDGGAGGDTLNVNSGTFTFDADAAPASAALAINIGSPGTVIFNATQHLASLGIAGNAVLTAGGAKVLVTTGLSITGTGKLDLNDNDLIVNYSSVSPVGTWNGSAYTGVTGLVDRGRGDAGNPAWDGSGIVTSDPRRANNLASIGVAEAATLFGLSGTQTDLFSGQTVDATSVLVKFTWGGDATLDGKINIDDYGRIDSNIGQSGSVFGWLVGDFNYDGKINIDDYGIIDSNISQQGGIVL